MKRTMKSWLKTMAVAMSLGLACGPLMAAQGNPVNLNVTVTIQQVQITASNRDTGTDTVALGTVLSGADTVVSAPISVTNSGNVTETYSLVIPSEPNGTWSSVASGTPGSEQYKLSGVFRAAAAAVPATGDYDVGDNDGFAVGTSKTANGADILAVSADGGGAGTKGYQMATTSNVNLWLKFHAPSSTVITTEQTVVVRISAQTP